MARTFWVFVPWYRAEMRGTVAASEIGFGDRDMTGVASTLGRV
jgi:hypothetical protein